MNIGLFFNPVCNPVILVARHTLIRIINKNGKCQLFLQWEHHVLRRFKCKRIRPICSVISILAFGICALRTVILLRG